MPPCTKAILNAIHRPGFDVTVSSSRIEAVNQETGERYIVYGDDDYEAAVELAVMLGFDLEE